MTTSSNNPSTAPIGRAALTKSILWGAGIALVLIAIFLLPVKNPKPEWGKLWMLRPFIMVPLAGAAGGAFFYLTGRFFGQETWKKALAVLTGVAGYVIALWLGTVLGLNGTLWN